MASYPALALALSPSFTAASFINGANLLIPFDNKAELNSDTVTSWVSSAGRRWTGYILYSCTITINLCIFTVLHLNIPAHGERPWKIYLRKTKKMLTALVASEIVLYVAFTQHHRASTLCKKLNRPISEVEEEIATFDVNRQIDNHQLQDWGRAPNERSKVSLSYGFFAVMGRFMVDVNTFCDYADRPTLDIEIMTEMA